MKMPPVSRRTALAAPWALAAGALAACDGPDPKSSASTTALKGAELLREQAKHLEPTAYVKTYRVDAAGPQGAYKTFAEVYAAVAKDRAARIGTGIPSQSNPWDWRRIEVAPGTYHESIKGVPPHTAIVGMGKRPEDVRVWWDGGDNTFESTGRSTYVRNIHLEHTDLNPDVHPMRDNGPSGDVDLQTRQRRTVVFETVRFTSARRASLGKCTNDMAPRGGVSLTFRDCIFDGPGQPQSINLITSQGDAPGRSTISFIGCTVISNHEQHPSLEWKQLSEVPAAPFGAPDFSGGRGDRVVWVDGRWDVGRTHSVQGLMVFPFVSAPAQPGKPTPKPSTQYIIVNPGSVTGMKTVLTEKALPATSAVPADINLPGGCLSAEEKQFYGSDAARHQTLSAAGTASNESLDVEAGQVYWVAMPTTDAALCVTGVSVGSVDAPGAMAASVALEQDGKPMADGNARTSGTAGAPGSGSVPVTLRWFYPGQGRVWVGVVFASAAKVPAMKATQGAAFTGTSQAGQVPVTESLTAVAAGKLVPRLAVESHWPSSMS